MSVTSIQSIFWQMNIISAQYRGIQFPLQAVVASVCSPPTLATTAYETKTLLPLQQNRTQNEKIQKTTQNF
jgi:hypothetical protein